MNETFEIMLSLQGIIAMIRYKERLYGLDADTYVLSLTTIEPNFVVSNRLAHMAIVFSGNEGELIAWLNS